jgi:hypothetical protein
MRISYLIVAALAVLSGSAGTTHAQSADTSNSRAFCAIVDDRGGTPRCSFDTREQCLLSVSGFGGWCRENPFYHGPAAHDGRHVRR